MESIGTQSFQVFTEDNDNLEKIVKFIENSVAEDNAKVSIVSVIGKTAMDGMNMKASLVTSLANRELNLGSKTMLSSSKYVQIDGYYDASNRIVLLHLTSLMDSWALSGLQFIESSFLRLWPHLSSELLKALLLLFHVSNIVMITSPTPRLDIGYINIFRILDSLRIKLQPFVAELCQTLENMPNTWLKAGRPFVPQLLFVFNAHKSVYHYIDENNQASYARQLEEQIGRLFRRSRLLSNQNPLFQLNNFPLKPFVYISLQHPNIVNFPEYFFQKLYERCAERENMVSSRHQDMRLVGDHDFLYFLLAHINSIGSSRKADNFIKQPCELMSAKQSIRLLFAFKDLIFSQTYPNISCEKKQTLNKIFESLNQTLDVDGRFSETRCSKMIPAAVGFYQEGLATHYNRETHESKLTLAIQNFTMNSRGPAVLKCIQIIQSECDKYWNNGHRMCEELSLTGNQCLNKLHRTPSEDFFESSSEPKATESMDLPVMLHSSMVKIISACDCGRRQGNRDDPFTSKAANYVFYQKMKHKCHTCAKITRFAFPFYDINKIVGYETLGTSQNNVSGAKRSDDSGGKTSSPTEEVPGGGGGKGVDSLLEHYLNDDEAISSELGAVDLVSQEDEPFEYDQRDEEDTIDKNEEHSDEDDEDCEDEEENAFISDEEGEEDDRRDGARSVGDELDEISEQSSLTASMAVLDVRCLPPMIHTLLKEHHMARFSSWSLVCLGSSRIYSHNIGIQDQQGFINRSHFMLPWNVTVVLQHGRRMPTLWEGKRPPGIKHKKTLRDGTQFTVKIFIGIEYECFKGHRFICSKPGHILKTNSNIFCETANEVATEDMPIFMHCLCSRASKSSKTVIAQLMRIHIVTPKAPIHVTINPRVQMTPNPSLLFYPGNREPIKLTQSSYWVLRLPMIYETQDGGPIPFPHELPAATSFCRLLKDCFGIAEQVTKVKN